MFVRNLITEKRRSIKKSIEKHETHVVECRRVISEGNFHGLSIRDKERRRAIIEDLEIVEISRYTCLVVTIDISTSLSRSLNAAELGQGGAKRSIHRHIFVNPYTYVCNLLSQLQLSFCYSLFQNF